MYIGLILDIPPHVRTNYVTIKRAKNTRMQQWDHIQCEEMVLVPIFIAVWEDSRTKKNREGSHKEIYQIWKEIWIGITPQSENYLGYRRNSYSSDGIFVSDDRCCLLILTLSNLWLSEETPRIQIMLKNTVKYEVS